jgi:cell division protein FtsQ
MMLSGAGAGIIMGDHLGPFSAALTDARDAVANAAGFRITKLNIAGRKQIEQDVILGIGGITPRTSLLFLNAAAVRDKLKASPWIADATVAKYYPDRLQIDITERQAFALWQQGGQLSVISDDGTVLESYIAKRFAALPLVVGDGAAPAAKEFLGVLARYPRVQKEVRAIIMVGERRWNLRLNNGIDVRLPEKNPDQALALLTELDRDKQIMSRDIAAIDLRLPDQVSVRLSDELAKARDDAMKDKKNKSKAGAA